MTAAATPRPRVTPRQLQVLQFIAARIRENGWSPTRREIALECLGSQYPNAAQEHVDGLIRAHLIEVESRSHRAITVTTAGVALLRKVEAGKL